MKKFAYANEENIFAKKEVTEGVLVYPSNNDAILAVGPATAGQETEFIDDGQIRGMRSRLSPIKGRENPGTWNFTTYVKPSGTAGTAPETDVLWECALGSKQINAGVSVVYSLSSSSNLPSFSMLRRVGHTVFFMAGCTVNVCEITVAGGDIAQIAWSGEFMKWWMAGESVLASGASPGNSTLTVRDATRFSDEKARIQIATDAGGWDEGTGSGYLITDVDYDTNVITISPNVVTGGSAGNAVKGWYPSSPVELGSPIHGALGVITIDNFNATILEAIITLTNNIKYYTDMKDGKLYPTVYGAPGYRDVNGTLRLYFYKYTTGYFYRSSEQVQDALIVPAGPVGVGGRRMQISCPQIEYKTPTISGDEEVMMELPFIAVGTTTGDDELTITFH